MSANQSTMYGNSKFINDPRELPLVQLGQTSLYAKSNAGTNSNCSAANAATFFGYLAIRSNAQASVATTNTFVTPLNVTGRGRLYNVISANHDGGTHTPTIEVTVDDVIYTFAPSAALAAGVRMVLGAFAMGVPSVNTASSPLGSEVPLANAGADNGFAGATVGGILSISGGIGIIDPHIIENYGFPFLQFERNCKVRIKDTGVSSAAGDKLCGAVHRMLPT